MLARPDANAGLKTFGIGLGVEILFLGCGFAMNSLLGVFEMSPEEVLSPSIMALTCGMATVNYLIYGMLGVMYGWFYRRNDPASGVGQAALGGAVTVAVTALGGQIIGLILNLVTGQMTQMIDQSLAAQGLSPNGLEGLMIVSGIVGAVIGLCIAEALAAGLGAAGAAIYAAIAGRNHPVAQPPG